eukprot:4241012-Pyramimonas_sp.AAC.1
MNKRRPLVFRPPSSATGGHEDYGTEDPRSHKKISDTEKISNPAFSASAGTNHESDQTESHF